MAIFVHTYGGRYKTILYISVLAPLWVGYLVRIYSWRSILGENGFLNSILMIFGILKEPSSAFLFNSFAVVITMLSIAIPFTFIPIFNAIEKVPANLTQAAADLGANNLKAFWSVMFPLSLPGVVTGFLLAFVISYGDYLTPALVGGPSGIMIGSVIQSQFGNSYNWPLGAALAVIMLVFILLILAVAQKLGDVKGTFED
nr:ABC transporter permease [Lederbergia citrea]